MCTLNTTILAKMNSCTLLQFSRKIYIICKNGQKLSMARFLILTSWLSGSQWKFRSYSTNVYTWHYHSGWEDFLRTSPVSPENLHCAQKWPKIEYGKILKSYPQVKWPSIGISVLFHNCVYLTLPSWLKRIPVHFSSFPGKFYIVRKNWQKLSVARLWSLTPWLNANFGPIPLTANTIILDKKISWKLFQFSRKFTLCTKMA